MFTAPEIRSLLVVSGLLTVFATSAEAGLSAPESWVRVSHDGTLVLVMLAPDVRYDRQPTAVLPGYGEVELHETFVESGVYDAETLQRRWRIDWYSFPHELLSTDDLRHLADLNIHGLDSTWAIRFYDEGKLVRSHSCSALLTRLAAPQYLPFTSSDWHSVWYDEFRLTADGKQLRLSTARRKYWLRGVDLGWQEFYTFDMATGAIVAQRGVGWQPNAARYWPVAACVLVMCIAAFVVWIAWRRSRRKSLADQPEPA